MHKIKSGDHRSCGGPVGKWRSGFVGLGLGLIFLLPIIGHAQSSKIKTADLPVIPVGTDAYRMWDRLPLQRIGVRAYMRSTYDRSGGGSDASHFLFMNEEDENVTLDVKGEGVLYFFRANHWHGSPWHFRIDGGDNLVKETATDHPVNADKIFDKTQFIPPGPFQEPMAFTWSRTKGADLIWTPMSFRDSLRIAYSRTFYGTGYYIYDLYANKESLSHPIRSWNLDQQAEKDIRNFIDSAGLDIAPPNISKLSGAVRLDRTNVLLAAIRKGPSVLRALKLTLPMDKAIDLERLRIKITWDNASCPSVDAPLCLFFGAGTLFNRDHKKYLVKGLPINIRFDYTNKKVILACYYPMPFFKSAKIELAGIAPGNDSILYEFRYEPWKWPIRSSSYFHATYKDIPRPVLGQDMTWLDTRGIEGHQQWSGSFVGTSFIFSHDANLFTLEGDPRFFFDDSQTPQAQGTGTEEWAGGGDYWGGENMTLPLAGHPCGSKDRKSAVSDKDLIQSAYRFLMADIMPFGKRAVIRFEHSENVSTEHYESVCYWYGLPAPSLVKTDSINIGNPTDEEAHDYLSPQASAVEKLSSRYEWGPDRYPVGAWGIDLNKIPGYADKKGKEIFPAHTENGRHTKGTSAFTIKLSSQNVGALLRRTLDYSYPNQTAKVYVAPVVLHGKHLKQLQWEMAGTWYLAGANSCMVSKPSGELGKRKYEIQVSNRRFRDDEFLIPARLTAGCSAIRVKMVRIPDAQPLFPGHPFARENCWSELNYQVYSYVLPDFSL